jgi:hypothetical protein
VGNQDLERLEALLDRSETFGRASCFAEGREDVPSESHEYQQSILLNSRSYM